ncbi:uncharacterized protein LOC118415419 [Branchiostoma floridae]|uniref:Uncharacterized protein LOC118415419 n=3 Tax=Branchiostoma floridae TaxID=7739 RepID=A0A9J7L5T4_BRAFL|nr:uncharacterized protein LOC118415419 [Branchiostoma floridae]XP_035675923.1 uncharacterized protein LOC118415419 [Branchiostoma floridae]
MRVPRCFIILVVCCVTQWLRSVHGCPPECQFCSEGAVQCSEQALTAIPIGLPSSVTRIYLSHNDITTIPASAFASTESLQYLLLDNNKLSNSGIEEKSFMNISNLEYLYLSDNHMTKVPPNLPPSLIHLDLQNNVISAISGLPFLQLQRLEVLNLENNRLQSQNIPTNAFLGLKNIRTLDLSRNSFTSVPQLTLRSVSNTLRRLDLSDNTLGTIPPLCFSNYKALRSLDLTRAGISRIDPTAFLGTWRLKELRLEFNNLTSVPTDALVEIDYLEELYLTGNPIDQLASTSFVKLSELKTLDISHAKLGPFNKWVFRKLQKLEFLSLAHNAGITHLDRNSFIDLPNLQHLELHQCGLADIDAEMFLQIPQLSSVSLYGNKWNCGSHLCSLKDWLTVTKVIVPKKAHIACEQPAVFQGLPIMAIDRTIICAPNALYSDSNVGQLVCPPRCGCNETVVDCRRAEHRKVPRNIPATTEVLYIQDNKVMKITVKSFRNAHKLRELYLQSNFLMNDRIDDGSFSSLISLQTLDLRNNLFRTFPTEILHVSYGLRKLDLSGNLIPSVSVEILRHFSKLEDLAMAHTNIRSLQVGTFEGLQQLKELDLSYNKFSSVPSGIFKGLDQLKSLSLRGNPITTLSDSSFSGLSNLRDLDMREAGLLSVQQGSFRWMPQLTTLLLSGNSQLTQVEDYAFGDLPQLSYLTLDECNIKTLTREALSTMRPLQRVLLNGNPWTCDVNICWMMAWLNSGEVASAHGDDLRCATPLQTVGLQLREVAGTMCTVIGMKERTGVPDYRPIIKPKDSTETLKPSSSSDNYVPQGKRPGVPDEAASTNIHPTRGPAVDTGNHATDTDTDSNIVVLVGPPDRCPEVCHCNDKSADCSNPSLFAVPKTLPSAIVSLRVESTAVASIPEKALENLASLKFLYLRNNRITNSGLRRTSFLGLKRLRGLYLSNNLLTSFPYDQFDVLSKTIELLDLSNNHLGNLPTLVFQRYKNLRSLVLRRVGITMLPPATFFGLTRLDSLFLDHNDISNDLRALGDEHLKSLRILHLSSNPIVKLDPNNFRKLKTLQYLDISHTNVKSINVPFLPELRSLLLAGNSKLRHLSNDIIEKFPNIELLDLHGCSLGLIGTQLFQKARLVKVYLHNNPWVCGEDICSMVAWIESGKVDVPHTESLRCATPSKFKDMGILEASRRICGGKHGIDDSMTETIQEFVTTRSTADRELTFPEATTMSTLTEQRLTTISSYYTDFITLISEPTMHQSTQLQPTTPSQGLGEHGTTEAADNGITSSPHFPSDGNVTAAIPTTQTSQRRYYDIEDVEAGKGSFCSPGCTCYGSSVRCIQAGLSMIPVASNSTKHLYLQANNISDLRPSARRMSDLTSLVHLHLENNRICDDCLVFSAFQTMRKLEGLYLNNNTLKSLANVNKFPSWLKYLDLSDNVFGDIPDETFVNFTTLVELKMNNVNLSRIDPGAFLGLFSLRRLHLDDNKLFTVPTSSLRVLVSLEYLSMKQNPISYLTAGAFRGLNMLEYLDLRESNISFISENAFISLTKLRSLLLSGSRTLKMVSIGTFSKLQSLRSLQLDRCGFGTLSPEALSVAKNLSWVTLHDNPWKCRQEICRLYKTLDTTEIYVPYTETLTCRAANSSEKQKIIEYCQLGTRLDSDQAVPWQALAALAAREISDTACPGKCTCFGTSVDCADGGLGAIPEDLPDKAELLMLQNNKISGIAQGPFLNMRKLRRLHLDNNIIMNNRLSADSLKGLQSLEGLFLSNNELTVFPEKFLSSAADTLTQLDLSGNKITSLSPGTFTKFRSLRQLFLKNVGLTVINKALFVPLKKLEELLLDYNNLTDRSLLGIRYLQNIRKLSLRGNPISNLNYLSFVGTNKLEYLDLRELQILVISSSAFSEVPRLHTLLLSDNIRLRGIHPLAFVGLKYLKSVEMNGCALKAIPPGLLRRIDTLEWLTLHDNPWACSRRICWLVRWMSSSSVKVPYRHRLTCRSPRSLKGSRVDTLGICGAMISAEPTPRTTLLPTLTYAMTERSAIAMNVSVPLENIVTKSTVRTHSVTDVLPLITPPTPTHAPGGLVTTPTKVSISLDSGDGRSQPGRALHPPCPTRCRCRDHFVDCAFAGLKTIPDGLPSAIRHLYLDGNYISRIGPRAFAGMPSLQVLQMQNNSLTSASIHRNAFDGLRNLRYLYLSKNKLTTIPTSLPNTVEFLHVHNNLVTNASALTVVNLMVKLPRLKRLTLHKNPWYCNQGMCFLKKWMESTNVFIPYRSNITCAGPQSIQGKVIDKVSSTVFCRRPTVYMGNGTSATTTYLTPRAVLATPVIPTVHTSSQPTVSSTTTGPKGSQKPSCPERCQCKKTLVQCRYAGLKTVPLNIPPDTTFLYLDNNQISRFYPDSFANLENLRGLQLQNNAIEDGGLVDALKKLRNLQFLYLNVNKLTRIPKGLPSKLEYLYLDTNFITDLTNAQVDNLLLEAPSLLAMTLHNNPWKCGQRLCPLLQWLNSTDLLIPERDRLICQRPRKMEGRRIESAWEYVCKPRGPQEPNTSVLQSPTVQSSTYSYRTGLSFTTSRPVPEKVTSKDSGDNPIVISGEGSDGHDNIPDIVDIPTSYGIDYFPDSDIDIHHETDPVPGMEIDVDHSRRVDVIDPPADNNLPDDPTSGPTKKVDIHNNIDFYPNPQPTPSDIEGFIRVVDHIDNTVGSSIDTHKSDIHLPNIPEPIQITPTELDTNDIGSAERCPSECFCDDFGSVDCSNIGLEEVPANIPATTRHLYLDENEITELPTGSMDNLKDLNILEIHNNYITNGGIGNGFFRSFPHMEYLYFSNNQLLSVPQDLPTSLISLYLDGNGLPKVQAAAFADLPNLVWLYLQRNGLNDESFNRQSFVGLSSLKYLNCEGNELTDVPLSLPQSLEILVMQNNKLSNIGPGVFSHLTNLHKLYLSNNQLRSADIPREAFLGLVNLQDLNLANNSLTTIPHGPPSLQYLHLESNDIQYIPSFAFSHLHSLKHLYLNNNLLTSHGIAPNAFSGLRDLIYIDLSHNDLVEPPGGLPASLEDVYMSGNHLVHIPSDVFMVNGELRGLFLNNNMLNDSSIHSGSFYGLSSIQSLDISGNALTVFPSNLPSELEQLHIRGNNIRSIPQSSLEITPKLRSLYLGNNSLGDTGLVAASFHGAFLSTLDLSGNNMTKIPSELPYSLEYLYLNNNHISTIKADMLSKLKRLKALYLKNNALGEGSIEASALTVLRSLRYIDLSQNRLSSVPVNLPDGVEEFNL